MTAPRTLDLSATDRASSPAGSRAALTADTHTGIDARSDADARSGIDARTAIDARTGIDARTAAYGALALRVGLGAVFVAHALAKPFAYTFPGTVAFFESVGFPGWTAYPVFAIELLGGLALLAGAFTRTASLALLGVMLGALSVHVPNGWMFTAPNGGWEYPAFLCVALIAQALLGPGAFRRPAPRN